MDEKVNNASMSCPSARQAQLQPTVDSEHGDNLICPSISEASQIQALVNDMIRQLQHMTTRQLQIPWGRSC